MIDLIGHWEMYSRSRTSSKFKIARLSLPDLLDVPGKTDVVGLKLIKPNANCDSSESKEPVEKGPDFRYTTLWEIVDNTRFEADVGVDQKNGAEYRIRCRVQ